MFLDRIKLAWKITIPLFLASIIAGFVVYNVFVDVYKERQIESLEEKAKALILTSESAREYAALQSSKGIFKPDDILIKYNEQGTKNIDDLLLTVPIVASMEIMKMKADSLDMTIKVPKFQPRNPKNEPDEFEAKVLKIFEKKEQKYYSEIVSDTLIFMKAIQLTQDCLKCHGDPNTSMEIWGNDKGLDVTGARMEDWKTGDVRGAFEVKISLQDVYADVELKSSYFLIVSIISTLFFLLIGIFIAYFVTKGIKKTNHQIETVTYNIQNGVLSSRVSGEELTVDFCPCLNKVDRFR